jgi:hypothetical protein
MWSPNTTAPLPSASTSAPATPHGLPAYTLPPAGTTTPGGTSYGTPFGVGASGASRRPYGGSSSSQLDHPPADSSGGVPQQRNHGTVYGGYGTPSGDSPIDMTMPVIMSSLENSGSLTGHILSQGWDQGPDTGRRSNMKVAIAMLVVLLALIGISLLFLATAGSAFNDMITGVLNK